MRNSDLKRREASCSAPEPLWESSESISSKKRIEGVRALAVVKSARNNFSDSPLHFDVKVAELQLKNVTLSTHDATALASIVLPVPGGPKSNTPFHGCRRPVKNSGKMSGNTTASLMARLASCRPPMSSNFTLRSATTMSLSMAVASSISSATRALAPPAATPRPPWAHSGTDAERRAIEARCPAPGAGAAPGARHGASSTCTGVPGPRRKRRT
mmetsp:Transcript_8822/g.16845  ORF Transcript_8822/g.16845 Transcript_8822/m.16845 type:complete len:214 (+) Transcript_8822:552-1193(+)